MRSSLHNILHSYDERLGDLRDDAELLLFAFYANGQAVFDEAQVTQPIV